MDDSKLGIQDKRASSTLDYRKLGSSLPSRASCPPGTGGYDGNTHANARFMMSFMVDARGRTMQGFRQGGFRIVIPHSRVCMPTRISCRMMKKEKLDHRLPIMENEALACRLLEMGPSGTTFNGIVIVEVPHIASMTGKDRELVVLRSDDGRTWKEHIMADEAEMNGFGVDLESKEALAKKNVIRITTVDFPRFFAIISRLHLDIGNIGGEGGLVRSKIDPRIQLVIPEGALTKTIKVGLQTQLVDTRKVEETFGKRVNAVSPIVSVERRRRMFHKPICLKIPIPKTRETGSTVKSHSPTLRLLCSITGGLENSEWQDTEAVLETFLEDCVCFTTSLSARYWLIDCQNPGEAEDIATELYEKMPSVPLRTTFTVAASKVKSNATTSHLRVSCGTGDRTDAFFGCLSPFSEVAKSTNVEVFGGESFSIEVEGNLLVLGAAATQTLTFYPFQENRLEVDVRVLDPALEPTGRLIIRGVDGGVSLATMDIVLPKSAEEQQREENIPKVEISDEAERATSTDKQINEENKCENQQTEENCCKNEPTLAICYEKEPTLAICYRKEPTLAICCKNQQEEENCCKNQPKEENCCENQPKEENCCKNQPKEENFCENQQNVCKDPQTIDSSSEKNNGDVVHEEVLSQPNSEVHDF